MEKTTRKINISDKEQYLKMMKKFDWVLTNQEEKNNKLILSFERDDTVPYYKELVELEKKATFKVIPNYVLLILMTISVSLMTSFIIVSKTQGENFDTFMWFMILFVPALLCLTSMVVISFIRNKQISEYIEQETNTKREINDKLEKLREKYGNKDN